MFFYLGFQRRIFPRTCFLERYRFCVFFYLFLIVLLFLPFGTAQALINFLSVCSIGYVCYSLFYQKFIARKWCTLCLSVQVVFVFLFMLSICTLKMNYIYELLHLKSIIEITTIFVTVTSIYIVIKPIIATQKEHTTLKRKYNELIYDENISQYLFQQELCLTDVDKVNKISIGNPDAEICLTLIFSPICVSCIKELQKLMPILQRKANTKLDLIFLLDQKKHPESIVIASHILSGYQKNPQLFAMILKKIC